MQKSHKARQENSGIIRTALAVILVSVAVAQMAFIKATFDKNCLGPQGEEISICSAIYDYQKYGAH